MRTLFFGSIVARTTASIIALGLVLGAVFSGLAAWSIHQSEQARLQARLGELLSTVESTVSIACFVRDGALAKEIGAGLMSNQAVAGVRIITDSTTLYAQSRPTNTPDAENITISRTIHSPFNKKEVVGEISLYAAKADIQAQAWTYTRFIVLILGLVVMLVAASVAWVVFNLITRPIKGISDELHRLEVRTGVHLHVPQGNAQDEIGRLVSDVNALIVELTTLLDTERTLRLEREASERRLALIFEKVDAGIFEVDADGMLHTWNPAFTRTLGPPPKPPLLGALMPEHRQRLDQLIHQCLDSKLSGGVDFELTGEVEGGSKWVELSLTPVNQDVLQGVINDITGRKRAELAAQQLATRDTLTGLLNRRGLDIGLAAAFERRRAEPDIVIALLLVDLDFFKAVNDTYGHSAGDTVLRAVSSVLERSVRRTDLVARSGGDEFIAVLVGIDGPDKAAAIANSIVDALAQPIDIGNGVVQIGASIGVAMVEPADDSPRTALNLADAMMYAAKQAGRNRVYLAPARSA